MNNKLNVLEKKEFIRIKKVKKSFGSIEALRGIDLNIYEGEVLGIIGDNGAGKSTLMKIISGVYGYDSGDFFIYGKPVKFKNPNDARNNGISIIYQELAMAEILDITTNVYMGKELKKFGVFTDDRKMRKNTLEALKKIQTTIESLDQSVNNLSGGQQRAVAIARYLVDEKTKLIIMDEPTAGLGIKQAENVIDLIFRLKKQKISVIFISHILDHVLRVSDRIIILMGGKKIAEVLSNEADIKKLTDLMITEINMDDK